MTTELEVAGMTCASCVAHVTRALKKVPGVDEASVNLATEHATVEHGTAVPANVLVEAIERAGYQAHTVDETSEDATALRENSFAREHIRKPAVGDGFDNGCPGKLQSGAPVRFREERHPRTSCGLRACGAGGVS